MNPPQIVEGQKSTGIPVRKIDDVEGAGPAGG
jgi:hypothetical protein